MKTPTIALLTLLFLSFSLGHAQEKIKSQKKVEKTTNNKEKAQKQKKATGNETTIKTVKGKVEKKPTLSKKRDFKGTKIRSSDTGLYDDLDHYAMRTLLEKIYGSPFRAAEEGYPAELDNSRNGNEVRVIAKNDEDIYRIIYRTSEPKEVAYYVNDYFTASEYELFEALVDVDTYEILSNPDQKVNEVFQEVGRKRFDNLELIKLEQNSVGVFKGTYEGSVEAYSDGQSWLHDGVFKSGFYGG